MLTRVLVIFAACMAIVNCFDICANNDDKCIENEIKGYIDKADQESSIPLFGGLSVESIQRVEPIPSSKDESLVGKVQRYMETHELRFQVPDEKQSRQLDEGKMGCDVK